MQKSRNLKKLARQKRREKRGSMVDMHNDALVDALDDDATHYKILHPTKGYRKAAIKRLMAAEGKQGMWRVFVQTIQRAQAYKHKLDKEMEKQNGSSKKEK